MLLVAQRRIDDGEPAYDGQRSELRFDSQPVLDRREIGIELRGRRKTALANSFAELFLRRTDVGKQFGGSPADPLIFAQSLGILVTAFGAVRLHSGPFVSVTVKAAISYRVRCRLGVAVNSLGGEGGGPCAGIRNRHSPFLSQGLCGATTAVP